MGSVLASPCFLGGFFITQVPSVAHHYIKVVIVVDTA
jgi:hypothetical protein